MDLDRGVARVPGTGERPRVRLSGPGALVACLPQLIGFPPVESLVVVGLGDHPGGRQEIRLTMRLDLAAVGAALAYGVEEEDAYLERQWEDPDDPAPRLAYEELMLRRSSIPAHPQALAAVALRNGCSRALVVAVSAPASPPQTAAVEEDPTQVAVAETRLALEAFGIEVGDALLVRAGRWWSYVCRRPSCCPTEGTPVSTADADLLAAELAWAGGVDPVLRDRSQLVDRVAARDDAESAAVRVSLEVLRAAHQAPVDRWAATARVTDLLARGPGADVSSQTWAQLLLDLSDVVVRDACLATWKGSAGRRALDLWCAATRLAPPGAVAPPATMAALVAYARGEGALAGEAVDRALADDPTYRMAIYADRALRAGLPPTSIRRSLVGATGTLRARGEPILDGLGRLAPRGGARTSRKRR